jgi:DNA-binding NtrC family response regulator
MTDREGKMLLGMEDGIGKQRGLGEIRPSGVWLAGEDLAGEPYRPPSATAHSKSCGRILLLMDDPDLGEWLLEEFRLVNAVVALSDKGRQGLALARSGLVDVVISEMGLPDLPGMDLLRELGSMAKMPKVILTTSRHSDFLAKRAIEHGASAVLSKPFDMQRLLILLAHLLGD